MSVVFADIDDVNGERVASADNATYRQADVSTLDAWSDLASLAIDRSGRLDIVHNNAYAAHHRTHTR